jgi:hypothetical protein
LSDAPERQAQLQAFARLDAIMEIGEALPSDRAAFAVLDCAGFRQQPAREMMVSGPPTA